MGDIYKEAPIYIGQMRVIPNSKNKYLKNKLGPLYRDVGTIMTVDYCTHFVMTVTTTAHPASRIVFVRLEGLKKKLIKQDVGYFP